MQASFTAGALAAILMVSSTMARADAPSALHSFYANLGRSGTALGLAEKDASAAATPVRGLYALRSANGSTVGYINEAGTLYGTGKGFQVLPARRDQNLRPLTPEEAANFRAEIMNAIDYDKLVKVNYGAGNDRKQLMFSAVDCGYCQKFEKEMAKIADKVNATIYVMPASLGALDAAPDQWRKVAAIDCARDRGEAWKTYWQTMKAPTSPAQCAINPNIAYAHYIDLLMIFNATGIKVTGTPTFIREDGTVIALRDIRSPEKTFGSEGAVPVPPNPQQWLVADASQPATTEQQQQPGPKKIKLNNALKSLFN